MLQSMGSSFLDNSLKDFVQRRAAGACLFKLVTGCMAEVSSSDMLQFLDDYVNELDDNFTFHKIREACCLPKDPPKQSAQLARASSAITESLSCTQDGPTVASTPNATAAGGWLASGPRSASGHYPAFRSISGRARFVGCQ